MLQQEFRQVTETVYNQEYEWALQELNKLIADDPYNSNLYSNKALLLSQLDRDQEAVRDLTVAIELNPRNYIAYFNLFSALYRLGHDREAFQQLCCSLSCLHLMRARLSKNIEEADKAIKYCYNNIEAHVLKGLIYSTQGKHLQAYTAFDEATSIDPSNNSLFELKSIAFTKAFPGDHQAQDYYDADQYKSIQRKLKCSYRVQPLEDQQFTQKLAQFNSLYTDINGEIGAVTQKVIKTQTTISSEGKSRVRDGFVMIEDEGQPTPKCSELRPQPGNIYMRTSKISVEQPRMSKVGKSVYKQETHKQDQEQQFKSILNEEENEQFSSILYSKMSEQSNQKKQTYQEQFHEELNIVQLITQKQQLILLKEQPQLNVAQNQNQQSQLQVFQSMISALEQPEIEIQDAMQQQYNLIYPLDQNHELRVSVLSLSFLEPAVSYSDLYCIVTYSSKLITPTRPTLEGICRWNQVFAPLAIPSEPADMKIKVYNKRYQSIRDEYIGQVQVLITTADLLKLPIFSKKGQQLGEILIQLDLVQCPESTQMEPDCEN